MAKKKVTQLKSLMDRSGMTVDGLAQILHLSSSTIKTWVNGSKEPYEAVLDQLCEALVCTRDELKAPVTEEIQAASLKKAKPEAETVPGTAVKTVEKETLAVMEKPVSKTKKPKIAAKENVATEIKQNISAPAEIKAPEKKNSAKEKVAPKTTSEPAHKPAAPTRKALFGKTRLSEASAALLRSFDPSKILKGKGDISKAQLNDWTKSLEDHFTSQTRQMAAIISALAEEAAEPKGTVIERKKLAELMEVAKTASDADIDLVIEMLKRMKS